jgi:hypothetical protein
MMSAGDRAVDHGMQPHAVASGTMSNGQGNFLPMPPIKGGPLRSIPRGILADAAA